MTIDRSTKLLLALLVIGVWVLVFQPRVAPAQAEAQGPSAGAPFHYYVSGDLQGIYIFQDKKIYRFKGDLGKPVAVGAWGEER